MYGLSLVEPLRRPAYIGHSSTLIYLLTVLQLMFRRRAISVLDSPHLCNSLAVSKRSRRFSRRTSRCFSTLVSLGELSDGGTSEVSSTKMEPSVDPALFSNCSSWLENSSCCSELSLVGLSAAAIKQARLLSISRFSASRRFVSRCQRSATWIVSGAPTFAPLMYSRPRSRLG